MYLKDYLDKFGNKKIKLFVDMDGVIADYEVGVAKDYDRKRPLYDSIKKLEEISKMENVELYILSVTRLTEGFNQKQEWLDKYAPFFAKENRAILSREANNMLESATLKAKYLEKYRDDDSVVVVIDDDPRVLKEMQTSNEKLVLLKDTALVE